MKKIIFLSFIILSCCTTNIKNEKNNDIYNFSENMSFDEFKIKLKVYSDNSPYPDIDN